MQDRSDRRTDSVSGPPTCLVGAEGLLSDVYAIVYKLDVQGRFTYANDIATEITGHKLSEWVGRSFAPLVHPDDLVKAAESFAAVMRGETFRAELRVVHARGHTLTLAVSTRPLRENGRIIGSVSIGVDISEYRSAERNLSSEKERLAVTLRSIADAVVTTDVRGRVDLMSKAAEELTAVSQEQARGKPARKVVQLFAGDGLGRPLDLARIVLEEGRGIRRSRTALLRAADGTERHVESTAAPIRDFRGKMQGVALVLRDVTERKRLEEELHNVQKLESVGLLAGGIAHDFNNILTSILGNVALAGSRSSGDAETQRLLQQAERACGRARELTQQLLTFSKGGEPIKRSTDVRELLTESARFALSGSSAVWEMELESGLWPIEADTGQMSQVLNNLLINAVQAMDDDGGRVRLSAQNVVRSEEEVRDWLGLPAGRYVRLVVDDDGCGIAPENLDRVFEPYFSTKSTGSGLGLATSYSIIRRHGGHISVESRLGRGSTFRLLVPASDRKPERKVAHEQLPNAERLHILVMDDEETVREVAVAMLRHMGHVATAVCNGEEAIAAYEAARASGHPFDVVVLDLTVRGGMGGKQTAALLRQADPDAKLVASSGYSTDPIMSDHEAYGFDAVVPKPYVPDDVDAALREAMSRG